MAGSAAIGRPSIRTPLTPASTTAGAASAFATITPAHVVSAALSTFGVPENCSAVSAGAAPGFGFGRTTNCSIGSPTASSGVEICASARR